MKKSLVLILTLNLLLISCQPTVERPEDNVSLEVYCFTPDDKIIKIASENYEGYEFIDDGWHTRCELEKTANNPDCDLVTIKKCISVPE